MLLLKLLVCIISTYFFNNCLTVEFLVKNYIAQDSAEKYPAISDLRQAPKGHFSTNLLS